MGTKETHSVDKDSGKITQTNYTDERSDGKIETRHLNPDSGKYTGKSVHDPKTGKTEYYDRESSGLGGCFLTTACVEFAGLPNDCKELQVMRHFRDTYVCKLSDGDKSLSDYYQIAPLIVKRIKFQENSREIFKNMLGTLKIVVKLVESERYSEAWSICQEEFIALKNKYAHD